MEKSLAYQIKSYIVDATLFQQVNLAVYRKLNRLHHGFAAKLYRLCKRLCIFMDKVFAYAVRRIVVHSKKIKPGTVMFLTYQGDFTCNPKAVAEELIHRGTSFEMYWVIDISSNPDNYPKELKLVQRHSYEFYQLAGQMKVFVDNTHNLFRLGVHKKKGQFLLQTWHGSLGIKRLDGQVVAGRQWDRVAKRCAKYTDYCISNSSFETEVFHTSYWKDVPILLYGHARNDLLFQSHKNQQKIRKKVFQTLQLPAGAKILLYAPTHKDGNDDPYYPVDYQLIHSALTQRFGGNWIILVRMHSRLRDRFSGKFPENPSFVVNVTDYPDVQELMIASDAGLTDYSSWIFDFLFLRRPGFILANDLDQYADSRSFYYPIETTPFSISTTNEQLELAIRNFDSVDFDQQIDRFLMERGCIEAGNASVRIADEIEKLERV